MNGPEASLTPVVDTAAMDRLFDITGLRIFIPGGYGAIGQATALAHGASRCHRDGGRA